MEYPGWVEGVKYVYCFAFTSSYGTINSVKIGCSMSPIGRLESMQRCNHEQIKILAIIPCPEKWASQLKDDLQSVCPRIDRSGEWFHPYFETLQTIRRVSEFLTLSENQKSLLLERQKNWWKNDSAGGGWLCRYARGQESELPNWLAEPAVADLYLP
jgi:hypothetical protein